MGLCGNCWLLLLLTLIPAWEVTGSQSCPKTAVSITPVNTTALQVTWTNLTNDFQQINLTLEGKAKTSNESHGHVIFNNLKQGMKYDVSIMVQYVNSSCNFTQPGTTYPSPVTNLSLVNRTTQSLAINWTVPTDRRELQYKYRIFPNRSTLLGQGSMIPKPGVPYNLAVNSVTPENTNSAPVIVTGTTNCSPISNLSVLSRTTESLFINWTDPEDLRVHEYTYNITVTSDTDSFAKTYTTPSGQNGFNVTDLKPGVRYNLTVQSVTPENTTSAPESMEATTNPSLVTNLSVLSRTTNSLQINWTDPDDLRVRDYMYNITVTSDLDSFAKTYTTPSGQNGFNVTDLKPGFRYNLTVQSVTPENTTSAPEGMDVTTNPSLVSNLSVLSRTTNSLQINWTDPDDLRVSDYMYNITVTSNTDSFAKTYTTLSGQNGFNVTDLKPGVRYNLTVQSVTPENTTSAPESMEATTNPSLVTNLSVLSRTTNSLKINWTDPEDLRVRDYMYNITVTSNTDSFAKTYTTPSGQNGFNVTDLKPGFRYNLTVQSVTPENTTSAPESMEATTNPSLVTNLSVLSRTTNSLKINWTDPDDLRVSDYMYNITVTSDLDSFAKTYTTPSGQNGFNVTDLKPGVRYNLTVQSVTPENTTSAPESMEATTNPSLVTNLSVLNRTTNSLKINWTDPVDLRVRDYMYNITVTSNTDSFAKTYTTPSGQNEFNVTDLEPGVRYKLTVRSVTPENTTSAPENMVATTNPSLVTNLLILSRTTVSLVIKWEVPNDLRVKEYTYHVTAHNGALIESNSTLREQNEFEVTGLNPGIKYHLTVQAVTPEHTQSEPSKIEGTTIPGTVSDIQCARVTGYKILVEWSYPKGNYTGFKISWYDGSYFLSTQNINKDKDNVTIRNLQPARTYTIHVTTQTGHECSKTVSVLCHTSATPIIIGAVIGSLLGLILIGLLLYFILIKRIPWTKQPSSDFAPMTAIPREIKPIPVSQYEGYFQSKHADTDFGFAEEYQSLSKVGMEQSASAAQQMDNKGKNRYTNVLPYDASRVKLIPQPENLASDYINASYMPCYKTGSEFIAAQGPLPSTVADFWRMVWEQKSEIIVMLTNCVELNRVKCEHYWPLDYTPCTYEDITVTVTQETILNEWTLRDFRITKAGCSEQRLVAHFHFTAWPDHGVPKTTDRLLAFHKLIRDRLNRNRQGPPVIHCSAGVGRTGTLIALDYLLQQIEHEDVIDVYGIVRKMRWNRPLMVQTEPQYIFLHQCMLDILQSKQPQEAIYQNQLELQEGQDLIYENVSAIQTADRLI